MFFFSNLFWFSVFLCGCFSLSVVPLHLYVALLCLTAGQLFCVSLWSFCITWCSFCVSLWSCYAPIVILCFCGDFVSFGHHFVSPCGCFGSLGG